MCNFEDLFKKASEGDSIAQCTLAARYATGDEIQKDFEKAIYWYKKASLNGEEDASYNLALMHIYGEGVDENIEKGLKMLKEAVDGGSSDACLVLAENYESGGIGLDIDIDQAIKYYLQAALFGSVKGLKYIARSIDADKVDAKKLSKVISAF